jgi:23S rRNA (cytidine2498-2'-O)-methyltransferase
VVREVGGTIEIIEVVTVEARADDLAYLLAGCASAGSPTRSDDPTPTERSHGSASSEATVRSPLGPRPTTRRPPIRQDDGMTLTGYLAPVDLEHEVRDEMSAAGLRLARRPIGRLMLSTDQPIESAWAANIWRNVEEIPITSIGDAAKQLRDRQRNWAMYAPLHHGRAKLIADKLPHVSAKAIEIDGVVSEAPLGSWALLEPNLLVASTDCSSPFANGEARLVEDRDGPPSRAYLKLYEAFVRQRRWPGRGETCLDLGASPGGWTWLLARTGASVLAVDKAPLADHVAAMDNVRWLEGSAFALDPSDRPPVDWLCSDIICYPQRLLGLVQRWIDAGAARRMVCTIKFQGVTDHAVVHEFASIPGSQVVHLHHNKHELTFVWQQPSPPSS